jgi:hypothetical protein
MKNIFVPTPIADVYGLYIALRKAYFDVGNVGSDKRGTYVYLADGEEKDPAPIVESWVDKVPALVTCKADADARKAEFEALPAPGGMPVDADHVLSLPDVDVADLHETEVPAAVVAPKPSLVSRFFRRIF